MDENKAMPDRDASIKHVLYQAYARKKRNEITTEEKRSRHNKKLSKDKCCAYACGDVALNAHWQRDRTGSD